MKSFVVYERYETAGDERVCAHRAHLAGGVYERGKGPHPPRHKGCRCRRVYSHSVEVPASPLEPAPAPVPAPPPGAEPAPVPAPPVDGPVLPPLIPPITILPEEPELSPLVIRPEYPAPPDDKEDE